MSNIEIYTIKTHKNNKYYKVYDEKGQYLENIDCCDENNITSQYLKGVTCFVINQQGEVLLEKRVNKGLTPGKIDLVSGHLDGEEVGTQAIIRELKEEVGIELEESINTTKVGTLPLTFNSNGKNRNFFIDFYYLIRDSSQTAIQKTEVEKVCWVPLNKAFEMIKNGETKFPKGNDMYNEIFKKIELAYHKGNENKIIEDLIL